MNTGKARWDLTASSLESLLDFLDADREKAAYRYEGIRRKLVRLFEWRGGSHPEELADETINRVARKLVEGARITTEDPYRYFAGVAHRIFQEILRRESREREALRQIRHQEPPATPSAESERGLRCLERCLDELAREDRALVVGFYKGEKKARIEGRKTLAARLGITVNALRIRAHRLRLRLETCVAACCREGA